MAEVVPPHRAIPCVTTGDYALSAVAGNSRTEHGALGVIPAYTWAIWVQNSYLGSDRSRKSTGDTPNNDKARPEGPATAS